MSSGYVTSMAALDAIAPDTNALCCTLQCLLVHCELDGIKSRIVDHSRSRSLPKPKYAFLPERWYEAFVACSCISVLHLVPSMMITLHLQAYLEEIQGGRAHSGCHARECPTKCWLEGGPGGGSFVVVDDKVMLTINYETLDCEGGLSLSTRELEQKGIHQ